jgi:glycine hydroxymethyltransferase
MVDFAGWTMPVRYGSITDEHRAVRERAGLFDISHMGVLEIRGEQAERFLDLACSNYVPWIGDGESQYGYLLDVDGGVIDDVMIYRRNGESYLVVVNAVNADRDLAWLRAVSERSILIDREDPRVEAPGTVVIRDLKDTAEAGEDALVNIALQGPGSPALLRELLADEASRMKLAGLRKNRFFDAALSGIPAVVSRTGYTGEESGYELFVHPENAPSLWQSLLAKGPGRVVPVGLGARDSLRVEAGLPLHGHELAGPYDVSPIEAGFGPYVKLHKAFFIGRGPLIRRMDQSKRTLVRFGAVSKGVRAFKTRDHVVSRRTGQVIGNVTSSAVGTDGVQVGMALVETSFAREGVGIGIIPVPRAGSTPALELGSRFPLHIEAVILSRFPQRTSPDLTHEDENTWRR